MLVTPEYLLKGYAFALEQCGLLLHDAVLLYKNRSYSNAVVFAAFAREELGRSQILLNLWRKRRDGAPVTIEDIEKACEDHVAKQRAGMLSMTLTAERWTGLGKILGDRTTNPPQSKKFKQADAALKQIDEIKAKRTPDDRHSQRMRALYVEPKSSTDWNRPADLSAADAHRFLQDAANDYAGRFNQGYVASDTPILKLIDQDLYDALDRLTDRPRLPPPELPPFPVTMKLVTTVQATGFRNTIIAAVAGAVIAAVVLIMIGK
jgi:AbiV family abortive infection protein